MSHYTVQSQPQHKKKKLQENLSFQKALENHTTFTFNFKIEILKTSKPSKKLKLESKQENPRILSHSRNYRAHTHEKPPTKVNQPPPHTTTTNSTIQKRTACITLRRVLSPVPTRQFSTQQFNLIEFLSGETNSALQIQLEADC